MSPLGLHAQVKTSDSCPLRTVTLPGGTSVDGGSTATEEWRSTSIGSPGGGGRNERKCGKGGREEGGKQKEVRRVEGGKKGGREWEVGREEGGREKGEVRKDKEGRRDGGTQNKGRNMVPSIQQSHFWPFFLFYFPLHLYIHQQCWKTQLICNGQSLSRQSTKTEHY